MIQDLRSEKLQNESSPIFFEFSSRIWPQILIFLRSCRASFRGKRRPEKIHQKSPRGGRFLIENPRRGGCSPLASGGGGGERPGGCLRGFGGGGLNIFFRGPNSHQVLVSATEKERIHTFVRVQIEYGFDCFQVRSGLVVSTVWIGSEYGFVTLVDESASESHTQNSTRTAP